MKTCPNCDRKIPNQYAESHANQPSCEPQHHNRRTRKQTRRASDNLRRSRAQRHSA